MNPGKSNPPHPFHEEFSKVLSRFAVPKFTVPIPKFDPAIIKMPTKAEENSYASAAVLVNRLAARIRGWKTKLPPDAQPVVIALVEGMEINVKSIGAEGHHGLVIQGMMNENECMLLLHQSSVKLLCYIEKVESGKKVEKIGFTIEGKNI